jgi:hypothetical protein
VVRRRPLARGVRRRPLGCGGAASPPWARRAASPPRPTCGGCVSQKVSPQAALNSHKWDMDAWALGIGHWALGIGHRHRRRQPASASGIRRRQPASASGIGIGIGVGNRRRHPASASGHRRRHRHRRRQPASATGIGNRHRRRHPASASSHYWRCVSRSVRPRGLAGCKKWDMDAEAVGRIARGCSAAGSYGRCTSRVSPISSDDDGSRRRGAEANSMTTPDASLPDMPSPPQNEK